MKEPTDDRRCGTCKWWELIPFPNPDDWGTCGVPLPICVNDGVERFQTRQRATDCPCWEKKGEEVDDR